MKNVLCLLILLSQVLLLSCSKDVRKLDLEDKQFEATINVDSTLGLDSSSVVELANRKVIYSFGKGGKGQQYAQTGMLSHDRPFNWELNKDSLRLDDQLYRISKTEGGFRLKSDSSLLFLHPQPQ